MAKLKSARCARKSLFNISTCFQRSSETIQRALDRVCGSADQKAGAEQKNVSLQYWLRIDGIKIGLLFVMAMSAIADPGQAFLAVICQGITTPALAQQIAAEQPDGDANALTTSESCESFEYQIGVASIDITPTHAIRLNGFGFRREETNEVGLRLGAQALAISREDESPVVLVTLDSLGIRQSMVDEVASRVAQSHGLPRENLAIAFSHSHCTPKVNGASDTIFSTPIPAAHQEAIDRYTLRLTNDLVALVQDAIDARQPGCLSWGMGRVGFAQNRRTPGGPVDHALPLLVARNRRGDLLAIHTVYACHCVTLSYNKFSGDWAGYARTAIERRWPGVTGLVAIGCGSDSNPDSGVTGDAEAIAAEQGNQICNEIARLLETELTPVTGPIHATLKMIELPLAAIPTRAQWEELAKETSPAGYNAKWQLAQLDAGKPISDHLDYPVQSFRFGDDLGIVFLAGEVCVDYALRLKQELNRDRLWLTAYANDFCAYIPSERLRQEGGYGGGAEVVYFALPGTLAEGVEQKIIDEVKRQLPASWQVPAGTNGVPASDPESAGRKFQLDSQLQIEIAAAEPLVDDPVAIDFDADGRVWVCEMPDYARSVDGEFEPSGRVRFLQDTDGDGRFDRSTVFLERLRFPTDVKVWRDGVLICDAPRVLIARDTDGDGKADSVRTLLDGFATHNPHARVNSLRWGLDGWLYGSCGLFGGTIQVFRDTEENPKAGSPIELGGRDFRWQPDLGLLEPVTGSSQQGRTRDDFQRWYGCDNGTLIRHYPIAIGPAPSSLNSPAVAIDPTAAHAPGVLYPPRDLVLFALSGPAGRPTSACGLEIIRSNRLGDSFYGNSLTCEPVNQLVHRRVLQDESNGVQARRAVGEEEREFLSSTDPWFRPVQVRSAPDGSIWVVDMVRYVIEHPQWIPEETRASTNVFAGQGLGRLWRITPRDSQQGFAAGTLEGASDAQWLAALQSKHGAMRDLAQQHLYWQERKDLAEQVSAIARENPWPATRLQAWSLLMMWDLFDETRQMSSLREQNPEVLAGLLVLHRDWSENSIQLLLERLSSEQLEIDLGPSALKRALFAVVARSHDSAVQERILDWLSQERDPWARYELLRQIDVSSTPRWQDSALAWSIARRKSLDEELAAVLVPRKQTTVQWQAWMNRLSQPDSLAAIETGDWDSVLLRLEQVQGVEELGVDLDDALKSHWLNRLHAASEKIGTAAATGETARRIAAAAWLMPDAEERLFALLEPQHALASQLAALDGLTSRGVTTQYRLIESLETGSPSLQQRALERWIERDETRERLLQSLLQLDQSSSWLNHGLSLDQRTRLLESATQEQAELLAQRWNASPVPAEEELLQRYMAVAEQAGDVQRGQRLFDQHCAACHQVDAQGGRLGPDLQALSTPSVSGLVRSILFPSADIDAKYRSVVIETDEGRTVSGLLLEEGNTTVQIQRSPTEQERIERAAIVSMQASKVSFMPSGFHETLDPVALRDLIEYLRTPQTPAKSLPGNLPRVIVISRAEPTELPASAAEIRGGEISFETHWENVGFWHGNDDQVSWLIEVEREGRYRVLLEYACDDSSAGNSLALTVGTQELKARLAGTGGWSEYREIELAVIMLPTGRTRVTMMPAGELRGALCDLRSVTLIPEE